MLKSAVKVNRLLSFTTEKQLQDEVILQAHSFSSTYTS